jgi:beta-fructofuranosidase
MTRAYPFTRRRLFQAAALLPPAALAQPAPARDFFYKPAGAWAADFIPYYWDGAFRLFYLHDWRNKEKFGEGTPWYQVSTTDFVHFTEHGEMLARGTPEEQDLYVFTGSVVHAEGRHHIFYTGHNHHLQKHGKPQQAIMHAVSDDLLKWTKLPSATFFAPAGYEPHDWRDPFVFRNEEANEYWMLVCARRPAGPSRRRGCTALCVSKDLKRWETRPDFYSPGLYHTHECPDLFRIGDWWYLVFSEYSEQTMTRYRMSRSLKGPWLAPEEDSFDGRAYYAAKTASDGRNRYLFGWIATRADNKDYQAWQWGGNLAVHEILQRPDGTLGVRAPQSVDRAFPRAVPFEIKPGIGDTRIERDAVRLAAPGSFGCCSGGKMPARCRIEARVEIASGTRGCGLMLQSSGDFESAYYIRLEPAQNRLVFDSWPRPGDIPHMVELERRIEFTPSRPLDLKVFVDGTTCVAYASGGVAMSARLYNLAGGNWGLFVNDGAAGFRNIRLSVPV